MSDIVFVGVNDWRAIKQRPQHLAERLSTTHRVIYVNPVGYSLLTHLVRRRQGTTQRRLAPRLEKIAEQLWVFTPSPALPFSRKVRLLNRCNQAWLAAQISPVLRRLGMRNPILWASFPTTVDLTGHIDTQGIVFDYLDNFPEFFVGRERATVARMETELLSKAGLVLATAQPLVEKCRRIHADTVLVPNGVDTTFFARARRGLLEPEELRGLSHPRYGYVGTIGPWTDVDTLVALAKADPAGSVIVVGPWEVAQPAGAPTNLHMVGARPYSQLPEYLATFDVALIPFRPGPLTQAVNPVKLFEYAAAGIPVVATATTELARYAAWCDLAGSPRDFVALAVRAAREAQHIDVQARREHAACEAAANDWQMRVDQINQLLLPLLPCRA